MSLATFLDAAYALQLREALRLGIPLLDALARLESAARRTIRHEPTTGRTVAPARDSVAAMNDASLRELQRRLGG